MSFLPIVERELRVRARLKSTYWVRMAGALVAIVVVGSMVLMVGAGGVSPGKIGPFILGMLSWPAYLYCLLEGARATSDCLSEEKRNGTLGLLFLTDLKGYDVVLGKLIANSLNSFYVLLAVLPLMSLPLLMGGVTAGEFWRLALVLVNTLFLSLTIGLCISAVSQKEQRAWGATLGIVVLLAFYPALADGLGVLPKFPALFSPSLGFSLLGDTTYRARPGEYWWTVACTHLLSWGLLLGASFLLPRTWQEKVLGSAVLKPVRLPWESSDEARKTRLELLEKNPVLWLASRRPRTQFYLWLVVAVAAIVGVTTGLDIYGGRLPSKTLMIYHELFWSTMLLHLFLALWVAAQASSSFASARMSGALELLLATPVTASEIVKGHIGALRRVFLKPIIALVLLEVTFLAFSFLQAIWGGAAMPASEFFWVIMAGLLLPMFIMDLYAAAWFGLWMGLISKKPAHAMTKTSLFVLLLPYFLCGLPCNILWPLIGIAKNWFFIVYAQGQLNRRFRAVVTEQFTVLPQGQVGTLMPAPQLPPIPPKLPFH